MALSGTLEGSIHSGHYKLRVSWSATQNQANNTSTITAKMYLVMDPSWSLNIGTRSNTCQIDGVVSYFTSPKISSNGGETILLGTVTKTITHNTDGTRQVPIDVQFVINATIAGTKYITIGASGTITLDALPRVSSFSLSSSSVEMGKSIAITISPLSPTLKHRIKYSWGQQSGTIASDVGTSYTWTVPLSLADFITTSTSGTCYIIVETMDGSTVVGSQTKSFTATVPSSVVPVIITATLTDPSGNVPQEVGLFVKGKSTLRIQTVAYGASGSKIDTCEVIVNGVTYSGTDVTTGVLNDAGTLTMSIKVTDSRGRTASTTKSITVHDYHTPIISSFEAKRVNAAGADDDDGTRVKISYATVLSDINGKNVGSLGIYYKAVNDETWLTALSDESIAYAMADSIIVQNISVDSTYEIRIVLDDIFTSSTRSAQVTTASVVMDFLSNGKGMGIGKVAEEDDTLDVEWTLKCRRGAQFAGSITSRGNTVYPMIGITVHRNAIDQNLVAANTYEVIKWTNATTVGTGLSLNSAGGIVIGEGVSVVRVSGQLAVGAQSNGLKYAAIMTANNAQHARTQAYVSTTNPQTINFAPKLLSVSPGNVLTVRLYGAQGDVLYGGNMQSYFTVEAVG